MNRISILGLNNNFYGSYSSNQVFFSELMSAFKNLGVNVYIASSVDEAKKIFQTYKIDFSISFSKYYYYDNNIPLYDLYNILNYQWVSDNPLKMNTDVKSKWIRYIFIDEEYPEILNSKYQNPPLYLPLGFNRNNIISRNYTKDAILVPCKIRNLKEIEEKIDSSYFSKQIKKFLFCYSIESSFIKTLKNFFEYEKIQNEQMQSEIFRLANEYTRIQKRLFVIENIIDYDIYILGDDNSNIIKNSNVHFISPIEYIKVSQVMNEYKYIINVDPNYDACVHDRFIKAVSSGTVCLTNINQIFNRTDIPTYSFSDKNSINKLISNAEKIYGSLYDKELSFINTFSWEKSAERIIDNYMKGTLINEYPVSNKI